jgi:hypothetical protein
MPFHPEQFGNGVFTYGTEDIRLKPVLFVVFAVRLVGSVCSFNGKEATVDTTMSCYLHIGIGQDDAHRGSH